MPKRSVARYVTGLLVGSALAVSSAGAHAEETQAEKATRLFKEGRASMSASDPTSACPKFSESQRLAPAPGTLLNLALCEEAIGKLASALANLRAVIDSVPAGDPRSKFASERAAAIAPKVPRLDVVLAPSAPPETVVERDGQSPAGVATLPRPLLVDVGDHILVASAPGRAPRRYEISVGPGERKLLTVEPGEPTAAPAPVPAPPPPPVAPVAPRDVEPPPPPTGLTTLAKVGIASTVTGIAFLGVGIGTGVVAMGDKSTVSASCPHGEVCKTQAGVDAARQGQLVSTISTVGFVVGGVAAVTGVALIVVGRQRPKVVLVPSAGGVSCVGTF